MADSKKTTFLLAGGLGSIHIYNLVKNVLSSLDYDIVAYNTTGDLSSIPNTYLELYNKVGIKIVPGRNRAKVGAVKYILGLMSDLKKLGHFDIVNLHYVSHYVAPVLFLNRNKFKRIVLTFWGSDLLRSDKFKRFVTFPLLKRAHTIQLMTEGMKKKFLQLKGYNKLQKKIKVLDFGDLFLDGIDVISEKTLEDISDIKESFGFNVNLPIVVIGYVGRPEMQQLKSVKALVESIANKQSFQLGLPIYGMTEAGKLELDNILKNSGISYKLFDSFMGEDEIIKFRAITDVFIHPQTTDALSCSVLECFYAGSVVINASWLDYAVLDNNNAYYHKFNSFQELPIILEKVIENIQTEKKKSIINTDIVRLINHWNTLRTQWISMYQDHE